MSHAAFTQYIDAAQVVLYLFWVFFAGLILYLRREDKREGYPLESDRSERAPRVPIIGYPGMPKPKTFQLTHGGTSTVPNRKRETRVLALKPAPFPGAPYEPTGNPMKDAVGPASYAERADVPDLTLDGRPKIVPMRVATEFSIPRNDPDPRGMKVVGGDDRVGGTVRDVWVDRSEPQVRYLEVDVPTDAGTRSVLLPIQFTRVDGGRGLVKVRSILSKHFADVPGLAQPDQVTFLEEDKISAYYGGGTLYAEPSRMEPLL